ARVRTHVAMMRARQAWSERLEHANRELDAFSYSVSHDLRTPLRAIGGFARMLAEDHGKHLDGDAQSTIERICRGVDRMSTLIDALLDLARIGRAPVTREAVDLSAIATAVVDDLRRASPDRRVAVDIAPGLLAKGDRRLLDVVLANLIRNAWKYSARADAPRIEVGRVEADVPTFFVRDNGAGFDMKYAKKLFAPFQRLHTDREFEGTGVGLATVQRAIARHGGRIEVDAAVNQGATFSFTLPDESPQGDHAFGP
ncbi:MAG TPA: ATP-binding protein, partial [Polyangiaceae bacterium]|nr:ATP-binding protein [Polyangiaceae bacterium]